ncbi:MAG: YbjN domain-containing protein [Candidatus Anammoxibacter sp.]
MSDSFDKVKDYLIQLGYSITSEDESEELVIIDDEENGIKNLIIDCEDPILILEQIIMDVPSKTDSVFKRLLQMNRTLVHGAFVLDEDGKRILFRDTLQIANLDLNEIEGSIRALGLALAENAEELLGFSKL